MNAIDFQTQMDGAIAHLREHDSVLATVIDRSDRCDIVPHTDYYTSLASSIIGQQLSVKAAKSIRDRFAVLGAADFPTPREVLGFEVQELRDIGLSGAKVKYVKDLAQHIIDGRLQIDRLSELTNEEIIVELTDVKGIGEWTAHMYLIFCLGRLNILPTGDLGIRKGVQLLYDLRDLPDPEAMEQIAAKNHWTGCESVASWYVWEALDNKPS